MTQGTAYQYRYHQPSVLTDAATAPVLGLSTTVGPGAPAEDAVFLDAFAERADVLAAGLLRVADVAASRFYVPPGAASRLARTDPIITAGRGVARFESLSACSGVAARLDVLPAGLDVAAERAGTTNVDVGPDLRHVLAGVRRREPLRLVAGADGLGVRTLDGAVHERVVDLPERWVRSLAALHVLTSVLVPVQDLDAADARRFVDALPRQTPSTATFWVNPVAGGLRLAQSAAPGGFRVAGPERLRLLAPVLRLATGLRVYAANGGACVTAWEVTLPGARLVLVLSPAVSRGFSGEGALLEDLAAGSPEAELAAAGLLGYDLATGLWFERRLPFGLDLLRANPRLATAHRLVDDGAVQLSDGRAVVQGATGRHLVRLGDAGPERCTCAWYARHGGDRGPCAHVLAVRIALGTPGADRVEA